VEVKKPFPAVPAYLPRRKGKMKIKWKGHACFFIECSGKIIVTDPFADSYGYPPLRERADLVTVSHDHNDHNAWQNLSGNPLVINQAGDFDLGEISIQGVASYHDQKQGALRGRNIIYRIKAEGLTLAHLGDLGHILSPAQVEALGKIDILLLPVGGTYTIDAEQAGQVLEQIGPAIVIPMHFKTPAIKLPIAPVEAFISKFARVVKKPFLDITGEDLQGATRVIVLDYLS
jgi:L-ascorbate metabolism protein UlaG (beta-lactamase superfamily)